MVKPAWASAADWVAQNAIVELLSASAASHCRVRYEDFVSDPAATLSQVLAPYAGIAAANASVQDGDVVLAPTHSVSGNPMRFKSGPVAIAPDDEWRTAMSRRARVCVAAATWPLLVRYGYHVRHG